MSDSPHSRKDDHVRLADDYYQAGSSTVDRRPFDDIGFVHHALAGADVATVDLTTTVVGQRWETPLYINAMTGGTPFTGAINAALAEAAAVTNTPIASGSMATYLKDAETADTFRVLRARNPNGFVAANINLNYPVDQVRRVVDLLEADALQLHLNLAQELIMQEGDRSFSHWISSIAALVEAIEVPVIVKEVGFGLSAKTLHALVEVGVGTVDLSGTGGTNFAAIEDGRKGTGPRFEYLHDWGQSTAIALVEADQRGPSVERLASGGVKNPLDVVRCLALGARAVGASAAFLTIALENGSEGLCAELARWRAELTHVYSLLGAHTTAELTRTDLLLTGRLREVVVARGLDPDAYSDRTDAHGNPRPTPSREVLPR
jgi:isopentenyl-diphosphate delta-isomerase